MLKETRLGLCKCQFVNGKRVTAGKTGTSIILTTEESIDKLAWSFRQFPVESTDATAFAAVFLKYKFA